MKYKIIVLFVISLFLLLVFFMCDLIVKRAIRKYVLPKLNNLGYKLVRKEFPGFFSTGNFREVGISIGILTNYRSFYSLYCNIYYNKGNTTDIEMMTIRIDCIMFFISKITYMPEI